MSEQHGKPNTPSLIICSNTKAPLPASPESSLCPDSQPNGSALGGNVECHNVGVPMGEEVGVLYADVVNRYTDDDYNNRDMPVKNRLDLMMEKLGLSVHNKAGLKLSYLTILKRKGKIPRWRGTKSAKVCRRFGI